MAYIQDTTQPSLSLDALTGQKDDIIEKFQEQGLWDELLPRPKNKSEFWGLDWSAHPEALDIIEDYCVQDLKATYSLYKKLARWYNEHPKFIAPLLEIEFPMLDLLTQIETTGAYVNPERLAKLTEDLEHELQAAQAEINARYPGLPKLSWSEADQEFKPVVTEFKKVAEPEQDYKKLVSDASKAFVGEFDKTRASYPGCGYNRHKSYIAEYLDSDGLAIASDPYILGNHCKLLPYNSAAATGHNFWLLLQEVPEILEAADRTPTGRPSLNKDFFNDVAEQLPDHLPIAKVIRMMKYLSICSGLREHMGDDNRIHCDMNHTRVRTTRLSTSNPNLQNIPRPYDDKHIDYKTSRDYGMRFRQLFTASDDDHTLIVADLDRIEVVVLAWFLWKVMNDDQLLKIVNSGEDVHGANAALWGITRSLAKTLLFLLIYGGSPGLIFKRGMTKTLDEAKRVFKQVDEGQPSINKLKVLCWKSAVKRGEREKCEPYVTNPFYARGVYRELISGKRFIRGKGERMSFNFVIQKTARDVLHILLLQSNPHVLVNLGRFVNIIHDEAIIEVPKTLADSLKEALNRVWEDRRDILPGVRINGVWNSGESWYEAK
jgi:DNA polymerase I-like protein with 3'-5' exonuclease and polymerase domains